MKQTQLPSLALLTLIVGLPQFSETVYTPALPDIAHALATTDAFVEYTLTIYLLGFALGTLFWGRLSDNYGRKPCLLGGLFIYLLGCLGCFFSTSISALMFSRLIQAFGGSTGSVLGQAMCRDAFKGAAQGKAYSTITSALCFAPAVGPFIGGLLDQTFGWHSIFALLIFVGIGTLLLSHVQLNETHHVENRGRVSLKTIAAKMIQDRAVIIFGIIVAICNGINFSYYAEGPFFLINLLGLTPSAYGMSFVAIAGAGMIGGALSRWMHNYTNSFFILKRGILCIMAGSTLFTGTILIFNKLSLNESYCIAATLLSMMMITIGITMTTSNALALALKNYKEGIGTASSLLGFFYYALISFFTLIMGMLHNNTLLPMPLYFWGLSITIVILLYLLPTQTQA